MFFDVPFNHREVPAKQGIEFEKASLVDFEGFQIRSISAL
jgi:hypothetical protein